MANTDQYLTQIADRLFQLKEDEVYELVRNALDRGLEPLDIINKGLTPGMAAVGQEFEANRYYLPELLLCAEIFRASVDMVKPRLKQKAEKRGTVVLGTIQQDIHDIGKNIVKLMFELDGLEVHDLGIDVLCSRFLEEQARTGAEIVAASAMITSTVPGLKLLVELVREKAPGTAVMIGGAPVSAAIASAYGADGTAPDCISAVKVAQALVAKVRSAKGSG
jgi:methanogenic corrinoid protein MtbC1